MNSIERDPSGTEQASGKIAVSREGYQHAMADLLRLPDLRRDVALGPEALAAYDLTSTEQDRLCSISRHRGMVVNGTLYRASRLVGIARRLPATVQSLGSRFREAFDAYLIASPNADSQFDGEARAFARFLQSWLDQREAEIEFRAIGRILASEASMLSL
jgi:hypothetical protein